MDQKLRYKRLRLLVGKLNKQRKIQAKKTDILCNDLIAAQRNFIKSLDTVSFTANFYESILGTNDIESLFHIAGELIKDEIADTEVAFFLRQQGSFQLHIFKGHEPSGGGAGLENCFTNELVDSICKSNKICTLEGLLTMGLQSNPAMLNKISAVTIPLSWGGMSLGFILIYRSSGRKLTNTELKNTFAVSCGLSRAITSCQVVTS